jgi:hypothetical protein
VLVATVVKPTKGQSFAHDFATPTACVDPAHVMRKWLLVESIDSVATLCPDAFLTTRSPAAFQKSLAMYAVVKQVLLPFLTVSAVE